MLVSAISTPMIVAWKKAARNSGNVETGETGETGENSENGKNGKNRDKSKNLGTNLTWVPCIQYSITFYK